MTFKTKSQINTDLRNRGIEPIREIKEWRAYRHAQGEPSGFGDFYKAHGACPTCAGSPTLFINEKSEAVQISHCPTCGA